ncbi:MAG: metallopeptidase family protein [Candidatus Nanopelagicales bacterium]
MIEVSPERFEQLVAAAVDEIPADLARHIENVAIVIEDDPPRDQPHLLGLYEGIPLTSRGSWYVAAMPDRIRIFRLPILRMCQTQAQVVREVHITVIHEIAHHFGISDATLRRLGAY